MDYGYLTLMIKPPLSLKLKPDRKFLYVYITFNVSRCSRKMKLVSFEAISAHYQRSLTRDGRNGDVSIEVWDVRSGSYTVGIKEVF